jgi:hypothetical protein
MDALRSSDDRRRAEWAIHQFPGRNPAEMIGSLLDALVQYCEHHEDQDPDLYHKACEIAVRRTEERHRTDPVWKMKQLEMERQVMMSTMPQIIVSPDFLKAWMDQEDKKP